MTAFVFPGQGSQSVGMVDALAAAWPVVNQTFDEASEAVGVDLGQLAREGPEAALNRTENTQPALLAAGVATWRVWREQGGDMPSFMAGHSLGEYAALVAAEAMTLADAAALVAERGRLMQQAVPAGEGAMAAIIGLEDALVGEICERVAQGEVVAPANLNSPGQVVIAGSATAVERAIAACRDNGARMAVPLAVSVPSHCELMRPAAEQLSERLAAITIKPPVVPVIHNVDVESHPDPNAIRQALAGQLYRPVRWTETILRLKSEGVTRVVECGPGKVLTGLMRRIDRSLTTAALTDPAAIEAALA